MNITREQLRRCGAGYTDERIATLVPADGLSPLEFAALDNIPAEDRMLVLLRDDIIPARELRMLACDWAEFSCRKAGWNDERSLAAIAVARKFAVGEASESERSAAEAEALAAWSGAARGKAAAAARSAWASAAAEAAAAAQRAASSAARSEWADAWASAARSAAAADRRSLSAWSAARSEQLADVVRVLGRIDEAAQAGKGAKE